MFLHSSGETSLMFIFGTQAPYPAGELVITETALLQNGIRLYLWPKSAGRITFG